MMIGCTLAAWALNGIVAAAEARPHLVLFLADDLSWADCSIYGATDVQMPNLQRLARDGITCTHAFVASPSCAPSRAALLTGLSPARNGAMLNHQLPHRDIKKWPAYFQELGYEVAAIGKVAHYAQVTEYGFDHCSHFRYHQDDCIEAASKWLQARDSTRPLCLLVGTNWPHVPWPQQTDYDPAAMKLPPTQVDVPETRQARARYAAAVSNADRDLGLIYDAARRKLGENTLFVFTADHGSQFPFGKWNCTDAGLRTPLVAVWPGRIRAGTRSEALLSWIDLLPTFLDAAGGTPPPSGDEPGQLSGASFLRVLLGERDEHRSLVFATHSGDGTMNEYPIRSVRSRDWRYVRNLRPEAEHHTHVDKAASGDGRSYWDAWVRKAEHDPSARTIVQRYHHRPAEELYDLRSDPWEQRNLAGEAAHAQTLSQLRAELDRWMQAQGDEGLKSEQEAKARLMRK
jgi:uncharacterized sulfatase